jgi:hypothetical protein
MSAMTPVKPRVTGKRIRTATNPMDVRPAPDLSHASSNLTLIRSTRFVASSRSSKDATDPDHRCRQVAAVDYEAEFFKGEEKRLGGRR